VPLNLIVSHVYNFGLAVCGRWYATTPDDGPDWGLRTIGTFLFPTGS
jgi:hypothetical protein